MDKLLNKQRVGTNIIPFSEWEPELANRFTQIYTYMTGVDCEALLVYASREHAEPFRYLFNFVPTLGDMWAVASGPKRGKTSCFLNFGWELNEAARVSGISDWTGNINPLPLIVDKIAQMDVRRIAVLGLHRVPWSNYQAICSACPNMEIVDIQPAFDRLRRIKTPFELRLLKEAARITDLAFDEIREIARPGMSENEISARILYTFYRQGAESAFSPLVMSGVDEDTAVIARSPRSRLLDAGDTLMIDIGAAYQGYQVDIARTMVLGKPNPQQQKIWGVILRAYDAVLDLARPGTSCRKLHEIAKSIFNDAGYDLIHRIGHGYGLATSFEWPSLDSETALLQPGMTLAIEPGIYSLGAGAMKLEDSVVITETGCEVLSNSLREL